MGKADLGLLQMSYLTDRALLYAAGGRYLLIRVDSCTVTGTNYRALIVSFLDFPLLPGRSPNLQHFAFIYFAVMVLRRGVKHVDR